jgi:hypothetical protein
MGQVMWCVHALSPHTTRHGTPAGHVMSTAHEFATLQSITQVPWSQVPFVHSAGQVSASIGGPSLGASRGGGGVGASPVAICAQWPALAG